jgi:hypothetical protein
MTNDLWVLNPDYDQRAVFEEAAQNLLKLDAEGSRIVKVIAQAMMDYTNWDPLNPASKDDFNRIDGGDQYLAFRVVYDALSDHQLAPAIATLAEAWQKHQAELEADEAGDKRVLKPNRRRQGRHSAQVLSLVPRKDDNLSRPTG